ncbi:MAG: hypothetical protein ABJ275_07445 [Maricaulaceae bacterium]
MDTTRLRSGLFEFIEASQMQLSEMRDSRDRINSIWKVTREVYQGEGADLFAAEFERNFIMLNNYVEMLERILPLMRRRHEALELFDAGASE